MNRALSVVLMLATSGCSVVFVDGPTLVGDKVVCTESMTLPLVDGAVAAVGLATPVILESMRNRGIDDANIPLYVGVAAVGAAALVSTVIGVTKVRRCRRAIRDTGPV